MAVDNIIIGKQYKYDNVKFLEEMNGAYGISSIDAKMLFKSKTLIFLEFNFVKLSPYGEHYTNLYSKDIIFYCKGMKDRNDIVSEKYGKDVWRGESSLLKYLTPLENIIQEEMDI